MTAIIGNSLERRLALSMSGIKRSSQSTAGSAFVIIAETGRLILCAYRI
jgi:hypothetical protein